MKVGWIIAGALLCCAVLCAGEEDLRLWRTEQGERIEARYVRLLLGKVQLETAAGEKKYIPIDDLSKWDKKHLSSIFVPNVTIGFSKKVREKPRSRNALGTDYVDIVTGTMTLKSRDKIECSTLKAEFYLVGEEVATDDLRMMKKASWPVKFNEENEYTFEEEISVESRKYMEYNIIQWRGCVYSGYAIVLRDRKDQVVKFKTDLNWLKEDGLDKLRQFEENGFFSELLKPRPIPRPKYSINRVGTF